MTAELRVAVIGSGFMGSLHARAVAELGMGRLVAVADRRPDRAQAVSERFGCRWFGDHRQLLEDAAPNAVVVTTPEADHLGPSLDSLRAGADLLVEKPLATTVADAEAIVEVAEQLGRSVMVGHLLRFEPAYNRIQQAVTGGTLGRIQQIWGRRLATVQEARRLAGRTTVLRYLAVHDLDLLTWLHPQPVLEVRARAVHAVTWRELEQVDATWLELRFADGALGVVEAGWCLPPGWASWSRPAAWASFGDARLEVVGSEGVASLDLTPMGVTAVDQEGWKFPDTRHWPTAADQLAGAVRLEVEAFLRSCLGGAAQCPDGREGLRAVRLAEAGERSLQSGRGVAP